MNAATIIAIIAITGLVVVAVIGAINNRKKGNSCCGCSMKDCCNKLKIEKSTKGDRPQWYHF